MTHDLLQNAMPDDNPVREAKAKPPERSAGDNPNWFVDLADKVLETFPDQPLYTCAAGISPSGVVHFGNFRDVMTVFAVAEELRRRGKKTRMLFSWDNFDRFRKVPVDLDQKLIQHIGKPLADVPDPIACHPSYAQHFQAPFEAAMRDLGMNLEYRYQADLYRSGLYDDQIHFALLKRREIGDILYSFMSDKSKETKELSHEEYLDGFYPISVYSRFTGTDKCEILSYDPSGIVTYKCLTTGNVDTVNIREDHCVKLAWKIDWAMRWGVEQVHFEPGGLDHATPGSSYDVSSTISREIFNRPAPVFQGYNFIGLQGLPGKMSGSKGQAVSPGTLLKIYEPSILKWLYLRRSPMQVFNLAFDSEVTRQYEEYDREVAAFAKGALSLVQARVLEMAGVDNAIAQKQPLSFRHAVPFGQIVQWQADKLTMILPETEKTYQNEDLETRMAVARNWIELYNPSEKIALLDIPNESYWQKMDQAARQRVALLHAFLKANPQADIAAIETEVYRIPKADADISDDKALKIAQRNFFKDVYQLLIAKETGPRLATFLWVVDRQRILTLLTLR